MALLLAMLAAWIANRWVQDKKAQQKMATVAVVVAATEIPYGIKVGEEQVKVVAWPSESIPEGAYSSKEQVVNRVTTNKFYPNEIITEKRTSEHLGGSTLSALIALDYRAITVRVDDVVGVAGFILPGNKVDILATKREGAGQANSRTLLQNIKVLAVDQEASPDKQKPAIVKAVTLELKPEQATVMAQAMQEGKIQLTLRNPLDTKIEEMAPVNLAEAEAPVQQEQPSEKIKTKKRMLEVTPW
jgi:pilus assembly protein CpaB